MRPICFIRTVEVYDLDAQGLSKLNQKALKFNVNATRASRLNLGEYILVDKAG